MKSRRALAGVDGCKGGWVAVVESGGAVQAFVVSSVTELVSKLNSDSLIAIDIPIGLTDSGARLCDVAARRFLKAPRASSVFPAPIRPILGAETYEDASRIHREADGKGISKQAFAIYPKIREVDYLLRSLPELQTRIREVHPEVSFAFWNDGRSLVAGKHSTEGAEEREGLINSVWPGVQAELSLRLPRSTVKRDDLNDAFAALWTATRIADGTSVTLPKEPPLDSVGLRMEIVA
ncbi:MAG: DUF429 domain-containing protein [Steroidobacteraceae bacterium]